MWGEERRCLTGVDSSKSQSRRGPNRSPAKAHGGLTQAPGGGDKKALPVLLTEPSHNAAGIVLELISKYGSIIPVS